MNPHATHAQCRLLVVDDDHDLVDSLCEWVVLTSPWMAEAAYGAADAVAQTETRPADAILLDMEMHGADGFATAEQLGRAAGEKHSAILALTGNAHLQNAASHDVRFFASLLKPADPDRLLGLLARLALDH